MPENTDLTNKDNQEEDIKQTPASAQGKPESEKELQSWWKSLSEDEMQEVETTASERGFKSVKDFWKSYREAEKKISDQGQTLGKARNFEESVVPILRAINQDPKLLEAVKARLAGGTVIAETNNQPQNVDSDVRKATEEMVVSKFEAAHGFDTLDDETRSEVRRTIGKYLGRIAGSSGNIPLAKLGDSLEDALVLAKDREEKLKNMLTEMKKQDGHGMLKSHSQQGQNTDPDEVELTAEQVKAAQGLLGGDLKKYKSGVKKLRG